MVDKNINYSNTNVIDFHTVQGLNAASKIYKNILEKTEAIKLDSGPGQGKKFKEFALKLAADIAQKEGTPIGNGKKVSEVADLLREVAKPKRNVEPTLLAHIRESNGQQPSTRLDTKPVSASRPDKHDNVVENILKQIDRSYTRYDIVHERKERSSDNRKADQNEPRSNWLVSAYRNTVAAVQSWTSRHKETEISSQTALADPGVSSNPKPVVERTEDLRNSSENFEKSFIGEISTQSLASSDAAFTEVSSSEVSFPAVSLESAFSEDASDVLSQETPETERSSDWVDFDSAPNPFREQSLAKDNAEAPVRGADPDGTLAPDSSLNAERNVLFPDAFDGQALDREIAEAVELSFDPKADLAGTTDLFNQVKADIARDLSAPQDANVLHGADDSSLISGITNPSFGDEYDTNSLDDQSQALSYSADPEGSYHDTRTEFKNIEAPGAFLGAESAQRGIEPRGVLESGAAEHSATAVPRGAEPSGDLLGTNQPRTPDYAAEYGQLTDAIDELLEIYRKARTNLENQIIDSTSIPIVAYGEDASIISNDDRTGGAVAYAKAFQNPSSATASGIDYNQQASQLDDVVNTRLPNNDDYSSDILLEPDQANFKLEERSRNTVQIGI